MTPFRHEGVAARLEGNPALHVRLDQPMPTDALRVCIEAALGYHLNRAPGQESSA